MYPLEKERVSRRGERLTSYTKEVVDRIDDAGRWWFDGSMVLYELLFSFAWGIDVIPYLTAVR